VTRNIGHLGSLTTIHANGADDILRRLAPRGNCGGAAGIAEMLLQSQGGEIRLLPALPAAWPDGFVSGLCARRGFEVALRWKGAKLQSAVLSSRIGGKCTVRYGKKIIHTSIAPGRSVRLNAEAFSAQ
jgi:alpha-L-fucosidase 2